MATKQEFEDYSQMPIEQLFGFLTENDGSQRKFIAQFLINKHLQDRAEELRREGAKPAERRANLALIISAVALLVAAAPMLWKLWAE